MIHRMLPLLIIVPLACALAGCSHDSAADPGAGVPTMYKVQIDQALADPKTSDFVREILSDYVITDAEYVEAKQEFSQCMADRGWIINESGGGGYTTSAGPGANVNSMDTDMTECENATILPVEPLYLGMQRNPEGLSEAQLLHDCFDRHGVTEGKGMSDDEFAKMVDDPYWRPTTPEGILCFWDRTGSEGLTVEQAEAINDNAETVTMGMDGMESG